MGLYFLTFPLWWDLGLRGPVGFNLTAAFLLVPIGAAMALAAPWLMRGTTETTGGSSAPCSARTIEEGPAALIMAKAL